MADSYFGMNYRLVVQSILLPLTLRGIGAAVDAQVSRPSRPFSNLPLRFEPNLGQSDSAYGFLARGSGYALLLRSDGAALSFGTTVEFRLAGANPSAPGELRNRQSGVSHYLATRGPNVSVPTYGRILYRGVHPGIDIEYYGTEGLLEYDFTVAPGYDPAAIRIAFSSGSGISVSSDGDIRLPSRTGEFRQHAPRLYQESRNGTVAVKGEYIQTGPDEIGFRIGSYDRSQPLIIDPVISFSSFLGGSADDAITAMALDASGNIYVTGWTSSLDFPVVNARQGTFGGAVDVFVTKINAAGNAMLYSTYLGGRMEDRALGIAVDSSGAAVITGWTLSSDYPVVNAVRTVYGGNRDAFVTKLSPAGNSLVFSTFLGGTLQDAGNGVTLDRLGNVYVTGSTTSSDFPILNPLQTVNHGQQDAFVTKLDPSGALLYSTYLGGAADDIGNAIAVDNVGNAYVTGSTNSQNFPVASAFQSANAGGQDAFVAKINAAGSALAFSTYLGGSGGTVGQPEMGSAIALDGAGDIYVAGTTSSANFPIANAFQSSNRGGPMDGFVTKFNPSGSALLYSTYLGGSNADYVTSLATDTAGDAYVAGYTISADFPVSSPVQSAKSGLYNAFAVRLPPAGGAISFGTYLGGEASDAANAIAIDSTGNIYLAGQTLSYAFPSVLPIQVMNSGGYGGFLARIQMFTQLPHVLAASPSSGTGLSQTFVFTYSDADGFGLIDLAMFNFSSAADSRVCLGYYSRIANAVYLRDDTQTNWLGPLPLNGVGYLQNSQCTLQSSGTSAFGSGNVLTLDVSLTFFPAFAGGRNIALLASAESGALSSGWVTPGTWTVPGGANHPPVVVSSTPSSGNGTAQTFAFLFSEQDGYATIDEVRFDIYSNSSSPDCNGYYSRAVNSLYLMNDAHTQWLGPLTLGGSGTVQNSMCAISSAGSSVAGVGTQLTINLAFTFQPAFTGTKYISLFASAASGALTSSWASVATWTVGSAVTHPPAVVSSTPSSGNGLTQTFSFVWSEPDGYAGIDETRFDIYSSSSSPDCNGYYNRAANSVYLMNDAHTQWLGPMVLGGSGSLQNMQCVIQSAGSSVTGAGTLLTLNLAFTFLPAFSGTKYISLFASAASGALTSSWASVGSWTVGTGVTHAPAVVSSTPSSGSGNSQTFAFLLSELDGYAGIDEVRFDIYSSSSSPDCNGYYSKAAKSVYLMNDAHTQWLGPLALGGSGSLQNMQCTIQSAGSSVTGTGALLSLNLAFTFLPAFTGTKHISLFASAASGTLTSSWVSVGTWTVGVSVTHAPVVVSSTPSSGSGDSQTFSFVWSEPDGYADIDEARFDIYSNSSSPDCNGYYSRAASIYLMNGAHTQWLGPLTLGGSGSLQNMQCTIQSAGSSVTGAGPLLTLNLAFAFLPAFTGQKYISLFANAASGALTSGWAGVATWYVK
jgi:hypothetical protein